MLNASLTFIIKILYKISFATKYIVSLLKNMANESKAFRSLFKIAYSGSALSVPYPVCECTPHAAPCWDPCEVDFPLSYCEEVKLILFNQL